MIFNLVPQAYAAWDSDCVSQGVATIKGIECVFEKLISPVPALLALVAVGIIIYSGIRLMLSGSDPKAVDAAWKSFTWAVIGLILLSAAWIIISLIGKFTGAPLSTFTVGVPTPTP